MFILCKLNKSQFYNLKVVLKQFTVCSPYNCICLPNIVLFCIVLYIPIIKQCQIVNFTNAHRKRKRERGMVARERSNAYQSR